MRQRRMPQLVQSPPPRNVARTPPRQFGTTTGPDPSARTRHGPLGRCGSASGLGTEARRHARPNSDPRGGRWTPPTPPCRHCAPLGTDPGPPPGPVQVPHIQSQHLRRSGGGLIQHPPQGFLPKRHVAATPQVLKIPIQDRPGVIGPPAAWTHPHQQIAGQGPALTTPRSERLHRHPPGVPRRRSPVGPQFLEHSRYPVGVEVGDRTITTHRLDERTEGLTVSTTSPSSQITTSEERLHRPPNRRHMTHRMNQ